jgi:hypothetical protein
MEKTAPPAATLSAIKDDYAAASQHPTATTLHTTPAMGAPQIAVDATAAAAAAAPPLGPQLSARPPVTVSPMSAIHRIHTPTSQPQPVTHATDRSAENQRIAKAIEQAQRAQAGLLLANLGAENKGETKTDEPSVTAPQAQPFQAHPYMLPRGAPPELISRAMEQAMAKYQAAIQQRSGQPQMILPQAAPMPAK